MKALLCILALVGGVTGAVVSFGGESPVRGAEHERGEPALKIAAPEIDANVMVGGMGVLTMATLILTDRKSGVTRSHASRNG